MVRCIAEDTDQARHEVHLREISGATGGGTVVSQISCEGVSETF